MSTSTTSPGANVRFTSTSATSKAALLPPPFYQDITPSFIEYHDRKSLLDFTRRRLVGRKGAVDAFLTPRLLSNAYQKVLEEVLEDAPDAALDHHLRRYLVVLQRIAKDSRSHAREAHQEFISAFPSPAAPSDPLSSAGDDLSWKPKLPPMIDLTQDEEAEEENEQVYIENLAERFAAANPNLPWLVKEEIGEFRILESRGTSVSGEDGPSVSIVDPVQIKDEPVEEDLAAPFLLATSSSVEPSNLPPSPSFLSSNCATPPPVTPPPSITTEKELTFGVLRLSKVSLRCSLSDQESQRFNGLPWTVAQWITYVDARTLQLAYCDAWRSRGHYRLTMATLVALGQIAGVDYRPVLYMLVNLSALSHPPFPAHILDRFTWAEQGGALVADLPLAKNLVIFGVAGFMVDHEVLIALLNQTTPGCQLLITRGGDEQNVEHYNDAIGFAAELGIIVNAGFPAVQPVGVGNGAWEFSRHLLQQSSVREAQSDMGQTLYDVGELWRNAINPKAVVRLHQHFN